MVVAFEGLGKGGAAEEEEERGGRGGEGRLLFVVWDFWLNPSSSLIRLPPPTSLLTSHLSPLTDHHRHFFVTSQRHNSSSRNDKHTFVYLRRTKTTRIMVVYKSSDGVRSSHSSDPVLYSSIYFLYNSSKAGPYNWKLKIENWDIQRKRKKEIVGERRREEEEKRERDSRRRAAQEERRRRLVVARRCLDLESACRVSCRVVSCGHGMMESRQYTLLLLCWYSALEQDTIYLILTIFGLLLLLLIFLVLLLTTTRQRTTNDEWL